MNVRRTLACLALLLLLPCCRAGCSSTASISAWPGVLSAGLESSHVLRGGDGTAVLGLVIRPPAMQERAPVSLSLVVDTSGSMAGHGIEHARSAARAVAESLADGDEASLVAFDSSARTLFPLTRIDEGSRARLLAAVDGLADNGATALFDGVRAGVESLAAARHPVRRLLLISDGQANVGPATAGAIVAALAPLARGVTLSTLGVGTDYDEAVLWAIAEHGAGGFYHLNDPVQLRPILEAEVRRARSVIGRDAVLEIDGAPGVAVLDGGALPLSRGSDGTVRVAVGDLYAGQQQSVALRVRVPIHGDAAQLLGRARLRYRPTGGGAEVSYEHEVRYQLTSSPEESTRGERPEIMVAADRMRIAHALTDAAALIKEGDLLEAQAVLRDERARLQGRRQRLSGAQRADAEALIALLRDPYIDAELAPAAGATLAAGATQAPAAAPEAFAALVEQLRRGQPLAEAALLGLAEDRLRILRNVPYARHGYPFKARELQSFFHALPWYAPDPRFDNRRLTDADAATIALVRTYEGRAALVSVARPAPAAAQPPAFDALRARAAAGKPLAAAELAALDLGQLRLLRNASFARHGHAFRAADLQAAFGARPWYRPDPAYSESRLSATDRDNVQLIKAEERARLGGTGGEALRDFQLRSRATAYRALHN